jgi:hypothetical protein
MASWRQQLWQQLCQGQLRAWHEHLRAFARTPNFRKCGASKGEEWGDRADGGCGRTSRKEELMLRLNLSIGRKGTGKKVCLAEFKELE